MNALMAQPWPSSLAIAALLAILSAIPSCRAFQQTSPILAWSTASGASLTELLSGQSQEHDFGPLAQLPLGASAPSLCPSGPSSLVVFSLSSAAQQRSFQQGFLSPEVSRAYNAAPESARVWIASRPAAPAGRSLAALVANWKKTCGGRVVVQELSAGDDIASVFSQNMHNLLGPRLVIFTTTALPTLRGLEKRQLAAPQARMPASTTGVFWRYRFLSDYLIIGLLVIILLFIPPILLGSYALLSIESPSGLKTKMIGQISELKGT